MRDKSMDTCFEGIRQYETPLCEVFEMAVEETFLSNTPGKPGDYNSDDDIVYDGGVF